MWQVFVSELQDMNSAHEISIRITKPHRSRELREKKNSSRDISRQFVESRINSDIHW